MFRISLTIAFLLLLNTVSFAQSTDTLSLVQLEEAVQKQSLLVRQQQSEIKIQQERLKREELGWLSSFNMGIQFLSLSNDVEQQTATVGFLPNLGVSLNINFEKLFTTSSRIRTAKAEIRKAKIQKDILSQDVLSEITELYYNYKTVKAQRDARYEVLTTVSNQTRLVEERFKRGETDIETYFKALMQLQEVQESYQMSAFATEKALKLIQLKTTDLSGDDSSNS